MKECCERNVEVEWYTVCVCGAGLVLAPSPRCELMKEKRKIEKASTLTLGMKRYFHVLSFSHSLQCTNS